VKAQGNVNGIQGEYFLPGEDGKQIRVTYTADATGFHPKVEEWPSDFDVMLILTYKTAVFSIKWVVR